MTLELTSRFNVELIDDLSAYFASLGQEIQDVAEEVGREIQPEFEGDIKFYPAELPNQRYVRTGRLRNESSVTFDASTKGLTFRVESGAPYDVYVRGTLNQRSRREATSRIARIHEGRWVPLWDITQFWQDAVRERFIDRFKQQYGDFVKTTVQRRSKIR